MNLQLNQSRIEFYRIDRLRPAIVYYLFFVTRENVNFIFQDSFHEFRHAESYE